VVDQRWEAEFTWTVVSSQAFGNYKIYLGLLPESFPAIPTG